VPGEDSKVLVGSEAPDFVLDGTRGTVRLADFRGREHVLLVFMRAFG
jgi:peroxiredoxin